LKNLSFLKISLCSCSIIAVLLPRKVKEIFGRFFDMTFAGQESMSYFENLVNRVLDLKREDAQVCLK